MHTHAHAHTHTPEEEAESGGYEHGAGGEEMEAKAGEDSSIFNQLESTRTMLETELGLTPMLQAYQLVQVHNYTIQWS